MPTKRISDLAKDPMFAQLPRQERQRGFFDIYDKDEDFKSLPDPEKQKAYNAVVGQSEVKSVSGLKGNPQFANLPKGWRHYEFISTMQNDEDFFSLPDQEKAKGYLELVDPDERPNLAASVPWADSSGKALGPTAGELGSSPTDLNLAEKTDRWRQEQQDAEDALPEGTAFDQSKMQRRLARVPILSEYGTGKIKDENTIAQKVRESGDLGETISNFSAGLPGMAASVARAVGGAASMFPPTLVDPTLGPDILNAAGEMENVLGPIDRVSVTERALRHGLPQAFAGAMETVGNVVAAPIAAAVGPAGIADAMNVSSAARGGAQALRDKFAIEGYEPESVYEKVVSAAGQSLIDLPMLAATSAIGGGPVGGFALFEGMNKLSELAMSGEDLTSKKGFVKALKDEAVAIGEGGLTGAAIHVINKYPFLARTLLGAGLGAGQAAVHGGNFEDKASAAITMGAFSAMAKGYVSPESVPRIADAMRRRGHAERYVSEIESSLKSKNPIQLVKADRLIAKAEKELQSRMAGVVANPAPPDLTRMTPEQQKEHHDAWAKKTFGKEWSELSDEQRAQHFQEWSAQKQAHEAELEKYHAETEAAGNVAPNQFVALNRGNAVRESAEPTNADALRRQGDAIDRAQARRAAELPVRESEGVSGVNRGQYAEEVELNSVREPVRPAIETRGQLLDYVERNILADDARPTVEDLDYAQRMYELLPEKYRSASKFQREWKRAIAAAEKKLFPEGREAQKQEQAPPEQPQPAPQPAPEQRPVEPPKFVGAQEPTPAQTPETGEPITSNKPPYVPGQPAPAPAPVPAPVKAPIPVTEVKTEVDLLRRTERALGMQDGSLRVSSQTAPDGVAPKAWGATVAALEQMTGKKVFVFEGDTPENDARLNGVSLPGGKHIGISRSTPNPALAVVGHELFHTLDADLKSNLVKYLKDNGNVEAFAINRPHVARKFAAGEMTLDEVAEEFGGDLSGEALMDQSFLKKMAQDEPGLFKSFANKAIDLINKVLRRVPKEYRAEPYLKSASEFRNFLEDALKEQSKRTGQKPAQKDAPPKFQDRHPKSAEVMDEAKRKFGTVDDVTQAKWLLPDGSSIYVKSHNDIAEMDSMKEFLYPNVGKYPFPPEDAFKSLGGIRVDHAFGMMDVTGKPTDAQSSVIERYVSSLSGKAFQLELFDGQRRAFVAYDNPNSRRVLNDIDKFFRGEEVELPSYQERQRIVLKAEREAGIADDVDQIPVNRVIFDAAPRENAERTVLRDGPEDLTTLESSRGSSARFQLREDGRGESEKRDVEINRKPTGSTVSRPSSSYGEATSGKGNPWVRISNDATNEERVLLVQFSSDFMQNPNRAKDQSDTYYDKLYSGTRPGYDRMEDFWEIPHWIGFASHVFENADVYVVRNMQEAKRFLGQAAYKRIAFSALDVNRNHIRDIAKSYQGSIDVGGYVDPQHFADLANVTWHDSIESMARGLGVEYKQGVSYRHFAGSKSIPRLTMSQGCLHKCAFCAVSKNLQVATKDLIDQQVEAIAELGPKLVYLNDKTFGQASNYEYLAEVDAKLRARIPDFDGFIVQTTAAQMNKIPADWLQKSGIKYVELGVETFNNELLKKNHKPATEDLIQRATDKIRENGMKLIPNILIGLPGETAQSYAKTLKFLEDNSDTISHINAYNLSIMEGTELYKEIPIKSESDLDQNVIEKSFHKDPFVHREFSKKLFSLGQKMLEGNGERGGVPELDPKFQRREKPEPKKTVTAYKLFRVDPKAPGKLFPLYVRANEPVEIGVWYDAESGEMVDGKVKSKIGKLAFRPGWHATTLPFATHIGGREPGGKTPSVRLPQQVWAEVEMSADNDFGTKPPGRVPEDGYYRFKTSPNASGDWIIGGSMRVKRVLGDADVKSINDAAGVSDLTRKDPLDLKAHGFDESAKFQERSGASSAGAETPREIARAEKLWLEKGTDSPYFRKWFGESKVVDENGEPLVLYHATTADFNKFNKTRDFGFHFGTADQANFVAKRGEKKSWSLMPVYLSIKHPARIRDLMRWDPKAIIDELFRSQIISESEHSDILLSLRAAYGLARSSPDIKAGIDTRTKAPYRAVIEKLESLGFDGFVYYNQWEGKRVLREVVPENLDYVDGEYGGVKIVDRETGVILVHALDAQNAQTELYRRVAEGSISVPSGKSYAAFRPEQIKSATGNRGTFSRKTGDIRLQDRAEKDQPIWYSKLERAIEERMPNAASPEQVRGIIKSYGVKPEEVEWTNLESLLEGKARVTKAEVLDYLRQNQVQVREVVKGGSDYQQGDYDNAVNTMREFLARRGNISEEVEDAITSWYENPTRQNAEEVARVTDGYDPRNYLSAGNPKFASYQLPGGENYRELLLTMPRIRGKAGADGFETESFQEFIDRTGLSESVARGRYMQERLLRGSEKKYSDNFISPHWSEPNVLAHVRFNDRWSSADGTSYTPPLKVLFVEEIQSDWHQAGRDRGYQTPKPELIVRLREPGDPGATKWGAFAGRILVGAGNTREEALANGRMVMDNTDDPRLGEGVPNAPFKKTWPELAFKRVLRYAAENGYDRVAWTTGEQQAERYDLSKQVKRVYYLPETQVLRAKGHNNDTLIDEVVQPDQIDRYVGKEAAKKLLEQPLTEVWRDSLGAQMGHDLSGLDLKVGGEGMKGFYDLMLPEMVNKYVKKWGGRVGTARFRAENRERSFASGDDVMNDLGIPEEGRREFWENLGREGRDRAMSEYRSRKPEGPEVHSLDITPSMRDSVMQGQPLFQKRVARQERGTPVDPEFSSADTDVLKEAVRSRDYAVISAWQFTDYLEQNKGKGEKRTADLKAELEKLGLAPVEVAGMYRLTRDEIKAILEKSNVRGDIEKLTDEVERNQSSGERSFLVPDVDPITAARVAKKYGQESVFVKTSKYPSGLWYTNSEQKKGKIEVLKGSEPEFGEPDNFYTDLRGQKFSFPIDWGNLVDQPYRYWHFSRAGADKIATEGIRREYAGTGSAGTERKRMRYDADGNLVKDSAQVHVYKAGARPEPDVAMKATSISRIERPMRELDLSSPEGEAFAAETARETGVYAGPSLGKMIIDRAKAQGYELIYDRTGRAQSFDDIRPEDIVSSTDLKPGEAHKYATGEIPLFQAREIPDHIRRYLTEDEVRNISSVGVRSIERALAGDDMISEPELRAAGEAGRAARGGYKKLGELFNTMFGPDAQRFSALFAALSPQQPVRQDLIDSLKLWGDWVRKGRPTSEREVTRIVKRNASGKLKARSMNAVKALIDESPFDRLSSAVGVGIGKVPYFAEAPFNTKKAVLDSWEEILTRNPGVMVNKTAWLAAMARFRKVADEMGVSPVELQEMSWSFIKPVIEAARRAEEKSRGDRGGVPGTGDFVSGLDNLTHEIVRSAWDPRKMFLEDTDVRKELDRLGVRGPVEEYFAAEPRNAGGETGPVVREAEVGVLRDVVRKSYDYDSRQRATDAAKRTAKLEPDNEFVPEGTEDYELDTPAPDFQLRIPQRVKEWAEENDIDPIRMILHSVPQGAFMEPGGRLPEEIFRRVRGQGAEEIEEFRNRVEKAHTNHIRYAGQWSDGLARAWEALSRKEKSWAREHFAWDYEDAKQMPSRRLTALADAWRDANTKVAAAAQQMGVEVSFKTFKKDRNGNWVEETGKKPFIPISPDKYFPHHLTEEARTALENKNGKLYDALVQWAHMSGWDVEMLWNLVAPPFATKRSGSLEHERQHQLPRTIEVRPGRTVKVLDDTPETMFRHIDSSARRLAIIEQFSVGGSSEYLTELTNALINLGVPRHAAETVMPLVWQKLQGSGGPKAGNKFLNAGVQAMESLTATLNLSMAAVPNFLGGPLPEMVRMGFWPTAKEFAEAYTTALKGADATEARTLGNIAGDIVAGVQETEGLTGKSAAFARGMAKITGFNLANKKINLALGIGMTRRNFRMMLEAVRTGRGGTMAKAWGTDASAAKRYIVGEMGFSEKDLTRMVLQGPSEEDLSRAVNKQIELVNAINESPMSRPAMVNHRLWRLFFAYSSYTRKMARTTEYSVKEFRNGNVRPLLTLLVAGQVSGELIKAARNFLKDRRREDEEWWERLVNNLTETGTLGMWAQIEYAIRHHGDYGHNFFADAFTPPVFDAASELVSGIAGSAKDVELRPIWESLRKLSPALDAAGSQVSKVTRDNDDVVDRLRGMVYLSKGKELTPRRGKEETARMLISRYIANGGSREGLIEKLRKKKDK